MPPLVACFPVCSTFVALGIVGLIMHLAGAGASDPEPAPAEPSPRPPYWVAPVVLVVVTAILLLLSLVTDG